MNFENSPINYTYGQELHLDFIVGRHLPKGFAPGPAGNFYQQAIGDSGKGANFRSSS
jgi:hypothetical protein